MSGGGREEGRIVRGEGGREGGTNLLQPLADGEFITSTSCLSLCLCIPCGTFFIVVIGNGLVIT